MQINKTTAVAAVLGAGVLFAGVGVAGGSTIRDDRLDLEYLALAAQYPSVGRSALTSRGTGGVLIAPDTVLTAAHVGSPGFFYFDDTLYTVTERYFDPQYDPSNIAAGHDFQVLILDRAVEGIDPVPLYFGSGELGMEGVFVGYGDTGTGTTGAIPGTSGTKRGFENAIDADGTIFVDGTSAVLVSDFDSPFTTDFNVIGSVDPLNLEGSVADIDSGGGLFIEVGGVTYLAGIGSFVADPFDDQPDRELLGQYGELSGFARISSAENFLAPFIPEPTSGMGALIIGASALLRRRRAM